VAYKQINVRLPAEAARYIEAAAALDDQSVAEFLKPMFDEVVGRAKKDKHVQEFLRMKAERAAQKEGKLTDLGDRRSSRGSG